MNSSPPYISQINAYNNPLQDTQLPLHTSLAESASAAAAATAAAKVRPRFSRNRRGGSRQAAPPASPSIHSLIIAPRGGGTTPHRRHSLSRAHAPRIIVSRTLSPREPSRPGAILVARRQQLDPQLASAFCCRCPPRARE